MLPKGLRQRARRIARFGARRLRVRATLVVAGAIAGFLAIVAIADIVANRHRIDEEARAKSVEIAQTVAAVAADRLRAGRLSDLSVISNSLARIGHVERFLITDGRTGMTLEVEQDRFLLRSRLDNPLGAQVLTDGVARVAASEAMFTAAAPIVAGDQVIGVVVTEISAQTRHQKVADAFWRALILAVAFLLMLVPLMAWVVARLVAPIHALTEATRRVASGDLEVRIDVDRADEIGALARSFRRMTRRLRSFAEEERRLAYVDPVTGLANRARIHRAIEAMTRSATSDGLPRAILFIDLDGFKRVNDVFGHDVGDKLLTAVAERLSTTTAAAGFQLMSALETPPARERGRFALIGRQGGDEFIVAIRCRSDSVTEAGRLAEALVLAVRTPFVVGGQTVEVGASIGIARVPEDATDARTAMRHADLAMYEAKDGGRNRFCFFKDEMAQKMLDRLVMEMELRKAIGLGEIEPFYMPKVGLGDGRIIGFEALARWRHPTKGLISPAVFIPLAEETGLVDEIDRLIMREAVRQVSDWAWTGTTVPVAVNMSARDFGRPEIVGYVERLLREFDVPGHLLEIEVTETAAMRDSARAVDVMSALKRLGVRFAIDDFGTGYSNLGQLLKLPVDVFKIDRGFIASIEHNGEAYHLVRTIVGLAEQMGLDTVAEGIETEEQADLLQRIGVKIGQGYLYGRPMPAAEAEKIVAKRFEPAASNAWMV